MRNGSPPIGIAAVFLLVVALALPAAATAAKKTFKLSGPVAGDANAEVEISVTVKNGKPKKVKKLSYENLDAYCDLDDEVGYETPDGERSGSAGVNVGPPVEADRSFRWVSFPEDPSRQVNVVGKVKRRGKKVTGFLEVFFNETPCKAEGDFTATR
jgi:hypothetical protein